MKLTELSTPQVSDEDLLQLEALYQKGIATRSTDHMNVLGFGEIGVAIGWPFDAPAAVIKRLAASPDAAVVQSFFDRIKRYEDAVAPAVTLTPTQQRTVTGPSGWAIPFLVQPLVPRALLCEVILANTEPVVDHPMVVAVRDAALAATANGRQAIDSQFSNFAWDGADLMLFDTGSPFVTNADGTPDIDLGSYSTAIPALLAPVTRKLAGKISAEIMSPEGNLAHAALSAVRIGQERWLPAVLQTFNQQLDSPITVDQVMAQFGRIKKDMASIKTLARAQRAWVTKVRRRPYDFFIMDSFTNEML